jgi:hypothetical protein
MTESLHWLISKRGFDDFLPALESRFRARGLVYEIHYGKPPSCSIVVRLESKDRCGEICAWESGDCDATLVEFKKGGFTDAHYQLGSAQDFHAKLAEVFLFVTKN